MLGHFRAQNPIPEGFATFALTRVWEPIFVSFREKCEQFLIFCDFALKKFRVQSLDFLIKNFLIVVLGVYR